MEKILENSYAVGEGGRYQLSIARKGLQQIYIVPNFPTLLTQSQNAYDLEGVGEVDLDVIIINSESKVMTGHKGKVCLKALMNSSNVGRNANKIITLADVRKSIFQHDGYDFEIVTEGSKIQNTAIEFSNKKDKIGSFALENITLQETLQILVTVTLALSSSNHTSWEIRFHDCEEKLRRTENSLRSITIEKNRSLDYMYRAFHKCIKTKKTRICELKSKLKLNGVSHSTAIGGSVYTQKFSPAAQSSTKKSNRRLLMVLSDTGSETGSDVAEVAPTNRKKEDLTSSDNDVSEDSRDTDVETVINQDNKDSSRMLGQAVQSQNSSSSDSLNDALPEFTVSRKLRSTGNQLKFNTKLGEKRIIGEEELTHETINPPDHSGSLPSPRKQSKIVEVLNVNEMYDCDNLMDQI